jgi:hypothetical protein
MSGDHGYYGYKREVTYYLNFAMHCIYPVVTVMHNTTPLWSAPGKFSRIPGQSFKWPIFHAGETVIARQPLPYASLQCIVSIDGTTLW